MEKLKRGPIAVRMDGSSDAFKSYGGGVITSPTSCSNSNKHGVLLIGHGTDA